MMLVDRLLTVIWTTLRSVFIVACLITTTGTSVAARDLSEAPVLTLDPGTHTAAIRQIAVDSAEQILVTASDDKTARVWDIASGRLLHTLHLPVGPEHIGRLYAAAISPQGRLALAGTTASQNGTHRIYLYDLTNMAFLKSVNARGGDIKSLQWSPDGMLLAAAYAGASAFRVFDDEGELVHEERLPADAWSITLSRNGLLALPVSDGTVRVYGIAGEVHLLATLRGALPDPRGVQFSPDGDLLAVGYLSRKSTREVQVDVFDVATQELAKSFVFDDISQGNLRNVAWQRDGRALYAAGSGYRGINDFIVKRISWPQGEVSETRAATNSITDLLPLSDNRVLFSTVEPAWGVLRGPEAKTMVAPKNAQFYEADLLTVSDDAKTVAWRFAPGEQRYSFSVDTRDIRREERNAKRQAKTVSKRIPVSTWENSYDVTIAGRPVPMAPTEISRAIAVLPDESAVLLATSRTLRRIEPDGRERWRIPLATEARAVNVSADGRVLVVAMADGTLRWRRAQDGAMLMSLFVTRDGRWVLWNEDGYFDAAKGADELIGLTINRAGGEQADYYPMSRYREKYYRPALLGRVLALRQRESLGDQASIVAARFSSTTAWPNVSVESPEKASRTIPH
ncbi:WD40 repeat domain-containing protein [Herbaspirillum sp. GCM10030257]|uniref:WD40 repeat domain-containing protein n=1 Tax=Herbaspirillum sp. GCM10030257 TaxID=3273393 RepID=UPI00361E2376